MPTSPRRVHLGLALSGGASLGAYHAGAVSALLTARSALAGPATLQVDAIGGASAGALGHRGSTGRRPAASPCTCR